MIYPAKPKKQAKRRKAKPATPNHYFPQSRTKITHKKNNKKRAQTTKEHTQNQRKKKQYTNNSTVCANKIVTSEGGKDIGKTANTRNKLA